jgi:hypothetical protein
LKILILSKYGGRCACCGEEDIRFLTIDHKNGGGNRERRINKNIYAILVKQPKRADLEVKCWNCNCGKTNGVCPHKLTRVTTKTYAEGNKG